MTKVDLPRGFIYHGGPFTISMTNTLTRTQTRSRRNLPEIGHGTFAFRDHVTLCDYVTLRNYVTLRDHVTLRDYVTLRIHVTLRDYVTLRDNAIFPVLMNYDYH